MSLILVWCNKQSVGKSFPKMESLTTVDEVIISSFLRIHENGTVERLIGTEIIPPGLDPNTHVQSKDVIFSQHQNLSARLFLPKNTAINPNNKLPLVVYYHGGGFSVQTPFNTPYHTHLNNLAAEANIIGISVAYRRAPEHRLPIAYEDSWAALKWVASHINGNGSEEWLNSYVDFEKVFLSGDSAGANIAHNMAIRYGKKKLVGVNLAGIILGHPFFWSKELIEEKEIEDRALPEAIWRFAYPKSSGFDDPLLNPLVDPDLVRLGCSKVLVLDPDLVRLGCCKVLVFVAEKDFLKNRGWMYYYKLKEIGWKGSVEIIESKGEDHVFYLANPTSENAIAVLKKMASFINE